MKEQKSNQKSNKKISINKSKDKKLLENEDRSLEAWGHLS